MNGLNVKVRRELKADGTKHLCIELHNETQEALSDIPYNVIIGDKKGNVSKRFSENIESIPSGDFYFIEIDENDYLQPFTKYILTITADDATYQYMMSFYFIDPMVNGRTKRRVPHFIQFFKRYTVFSCTVLLAVASFIFFKPYQPVTPEMSRNFLYYYAYISIFSVLYFLPTAAALLSFLIPYMITRAQPTGKQVTGTVSFSGQADLRLHDFGSGFKFNVTSKMLQNIFVYTFFINIFLIAYISLNGVYPFPKLGYNLLDALLIMFVKNRPFIGTSYNNLNLIIVIVEYLLILLLPIIPFKLSKKIPRLVKSITSVYWGLVFGCMITYILTLLPKIYLWITA